MKNFFHFLTSVFAGLASNFVTIYLQKTNSEISVNWVWVIYLFSMQKGESGVGPRYLVVLQTKMDKYMAKIGLETDFMTPETRV
jgi:hypothetical protein